MYPIYNQNWRNISTVYIYIKKLASNEIFSPSNKIHGEVGRAKDLSAPLYRRLGGPQGRSGRVRKILPPPGFDAQTAQPVGNHSTDWTIPAPFLNVWGPSIFHTAVRFIQHWKHVNACHYSCWVGSPLLSTNMARPTESTLRKANTRVNIEEAQSICKNTGREHE